MTSSRPYPTRSATLAVVMAFVLVACGNGATGTGNGGPENGDNDSNGPSSPGPTPTTQPQNGANQGASEGDCALVSAADISELYDGRLVETGRHGGDQRGDGCIITLEPADEDVVVASAEMVVQVYPDELTRGVLGQLAHSPNATEVDIGLEALIQGFSQIDVLVDEDTGLRIGANIFLFNPATMQPSFDDVEQWGEGVRERLIALAHRVVDQLP